MGLSISIQQFQHRAHNLVIWGHIDIMVEAVRSLSRSEQVKTLLAGPSPTSPMKAEITIA